MTRTTTMRFRTCAMLCMLLALPAAARADTVFLRNGDTVDCTIRQAEKDRLLVDTDDGPKEFTRDEVDYFIMPKRDAAGDVVTGPDGKPVMAEYMFKPEPPTLPFELKTPHYLVRTDISEKVAKNIGGAMEHMYKAYRAIFHPDEADEPRVDVIVFDMEEAFKKYAGDIRAAPTEDTLGFYRVGNEKNPAQIVTYRREEGEHNTLSTLFHEGAHQFLVMVTGADHLPPLWLNEGFAVYFENSRWENGKLRTGVIPADRLARLQHAIREGEHVHLADLIRRQADTYDALCYAEGWSLVYFFIKADGGAYRKRLSAFLDLIKEGKDADEAFRKCFARDMDELERTWKQFVLKLKAPERDDN